MCLRRIALESYIVHIYRRDESDAEVISGLVEGSGLKKPAVFSSVRELCQILKKQAGAKRASKKNRTVQI